MSDKKSFILYGSYYEQVMMLSVEERGQLLTAIYEYQISGEVSVEMSPIAAMAFAFVRSDMDRDNAKYEERCAKNRANGKKGGRPRKTEKTAEEEQEPVREEELIQEGIPSEYIAERQQRAEVYAKKRGVSVTQMLRSWWKSDAKGVPPKPKAAASTDEVDDWFKAKLQKQFGGKLKVEN